MFFFSRKCVIKLHYCNSITTFFLKLTIRSCLKLGCRSSFSNRLNSQTGCLLQLLYSHKFWKYFFSRHKKHKYIFYFIVHIIDQLVQSICYISTLRCSCVLRKIFEWWHCLFMYCWSEGNYLVRKKFSPFRGTSSYVLRHLPRYCPLNVFHCLLCSELFKALWRVEIGSGWIILM